MTTVIEGKFNYGDTSLFSKTWKPQGPIKAKLVFVHGFSEHIDRYNDFFPQFAKNGIQVFAWDQRGWGRSVAKPADKGLTGPTSQVVRDVATFIRDRIDEDAGDPLRPPMFVMGHSMGGGEILTLAGDTQYVQLVNQIRGWILDAPFIGFTQGEEPSSLKVLAGRIVARLLPYMQLKHVVPPEHLSRDSVIVESVRNDPLCHNTGTLEGLASLLDRTASLSSGRVTLGKQVRSILLAHGTGDRVCSYDAAVQFMENQYAVKDKTTKTYEGAYHQLHVDHCKDAFAKDVVSWILERCESSAGDAPSFDAKL
ncbi:alpha/beta hydrolase [Drechmeria coniospora]|uniref:Alpha/beta hydrolase n=1 Tax=Drechmeria coniospora TaxID=98403 RepID=A0A151GRT9_DRECN|nr:alpha/beta hydrolase [Drechmeria coniospora]KYK59722.1 alpha/beta hydrolase [Drechmeria coniospora]